MPTIVIMEDDVPLASDWQYHLECAGHEVIQTRDATECLHYLSEHHADLVIADVYIQRDGAIVPDGGIKLIGLLRATGGQTEHATLPIICVTGSSRETTRIPPVLDLAKTLGATAVLQKPVAIPELSYCVETLLRQVSVHK